MARRMWGGSIYSTYDYKIRHLITRSPSYLKDGDTW